ncbi:homoserine kinase [Salinibacterium sp. SWN139]|uniref:homoserine kinase n=1 Tax=Salinibacterium sp. SWN139 TaxID=2792055 RepID=UPI0018CF157D|nr:homoserine kinase [Salinibacterium sp. SWN139]MBH0055168.1 homoserine kinase [Salinibacterium sp. SWN139]
MTSLVGRSVVVRVPATSANLGPGFDTLGLALSHYDELIVTAVEGSGVTIDVTGVGAGIVATDESNLVIQAIQHCFTHFGQTMPALHVSATNVIPHGGGLGSSAAAIVSGVMAAKGLLEGIVEMDAATLLVLATELEGHPDNVAPALLGGLTIAWTTDSGPQAKKLMVHRGVSPLVLVPDFRVSTAHARSLQPDAVPYADAVYNVSRAALLIAALTQSPEVLLEATGDRLHQDYRAAAMPQTTELIRMLRSHGHAAVVSGAGPSVLVLADDPARRLEAAALVQEHAATPWESLLLAVDFKGATVNEHQVEATA